MKAFQLEGKEMATVHTCMYTVAPNSDIIRPLSRVPLAFVGQERVTKA